MAEYQKIDESQEDQSKSKSHMSPELLAELNTGPDGLSTAQSRRRLARDGPNKLPQKKVNPFLKFLSYYWGPMPIMIWIAIFVQGGRQAWLDFGVLLLLQFINGFVGWYQQRNAGNAIEALKKNLAPKAWVKRDGQWDNIEAVDLVQGDRVRIKLGDIIPADSLVGPGYLQVDQSALTGESLAVTRYEGDTVFQGSVCKRGELECIVCATGARTFFGKTSALVSQVNNTGNFQKVLLRVTFFLMVVSIVLVIIILIVVLSKGNDILETIGICVVLLVASIPIAMQVVCTTTMAVGAHALAQKDAIVSRLSSIQELAGMMILCSDKTGTLTKNELTVQQPSLLKDYTIQDIFQVAALAAKREGASQDAIDKCVTEYAINRCKLSFHEYEQENFIPFDPKIKRTEATVRHSRTGDTFKCTKGAPQVVLAMSNDPSIEQEVTQQVNDLASRGYRTLGVAKTLPDGNWSFLGLIPLYDPPRDDTKQTIQKAIHMQVSVKMITGDQIAIAKQTARLLSLGDRIYNSDMLSDDATQVQRQLLDSVVVQADGFAQVFPEHKFAIVKILRDKGYRCGMTGDGVNDAPALKIADVGIAVEGATDAARAAADIVLISPGLSIIIEAIYRARKIFQRMLNYCTYRIACTFQLLIFFFVAMVAIDPSGYPCGGNGYHCGDVPNTFALPVIAIVIITLLNDGTIISIAYDRVTVSKKPEKWNLPLVFANACLLGGIAFISSIILLLMGMNNMENNSGDSILKAFGIKSTSYGEVLTMLYMKVSLSDFLTVFAARTNNFFWTRAPGKFLLISFVVATTTATFFSVYWFLNFSTGESSSIPDMEPISWGIAVFIWFYDLIFFVIQDCTKVLFLKTLDKYMAMKGKEAHFSGAVLTDTFLVFQTGRDVKKSIVTRRSMAAAQQTS